MAGLPFWDRNEAGYEGPDYALQPWDTIYLNGEQWPGVITAECRPVMKIDHKKPNGSDGGILIERGYENAKIIITVKFWTPAQWVILQQRIPTIWRQPGKPWPSESKDKKNIKAIAVDHPALALLNIFKIAIENVESPRPAGEFGAYILRINAIQYFEPTGDQTRRHKGADFKLTPARQEIQNAVNKKPSETDGVPSLPATPARGTS